MVPPDHTTPSPGLAWIETQSGRNCDSSSLPTTSARFLRDRARTLLLLRRRIDDLELRARTRSRRSSPDVWLNFGRPPIHCGSRRPPAWWSTQGGRVRRPMASLSKGGIGRLRFAQPPRRHSSTTFRSTAHTTSGNTCPRSSRRHAAVRPSRRTSFRGIGSCACRVCRPLGSHPCGAAPVWCCTAGGGASQCGVASPRARSNEAKSARRSTTLPAHSPIRTTETPNPEGSSEAW